MRGRAPGQRLVVAVALLLTAACGISTTAYTPLFARGVPGIASQSRGTLKGDFEWAAAAPTVAEAAARWEKFLATHAAGAAGYEDAFQAMHVDAARIELMRVYYLLGRRAEGDGLLEQVDPLRLRR